MPKRQLPEGVAEDGEVSVFLYLDADGEPVITTDKPFAMVGDIVGLKVVNANKIGAFLDWGMKRICSCCQAASRTSRCRWAMSTWCTLCWTTRGAWWAPAAWSASCASIPFKAGDEVTVAGEHTPLGIKAVVNGQYSGMLFKNEVFGRLMTGRPLTAWVEAGT